MRSKNIKSIEEKLLTKKDSVSSNAERDKVPKWSKAAFQDKFNIMKGKLDAPIDLNDGSKYNARLITRVNEYYDLPT